MSDRRLSAAMAIALVETIELGGKLVCWQRHYWTYPNCPAKLVNRSRNRVPEWYVAAPTVKALVRHGHLKFTTFRLSRGERVPIAAELVTA